MVATLLMCVSVYVTWQLFLFAVKSPEIEIIVRKTSATDRDVLLAGLGWGGITKREIVR